MADTRSHKKDTSERGPQSQEETSRNQEANFRSSMKAEFQQMFQDMADQNREQIHKIIEEKLGLILNTIRPPCSYTTFLSCQPPEFSGSTDPTAILNWITKMERVFDLCECGESQKVKFAVGMLKGNAWSWWNMTQAFLGKETASCLTWGEFVEKVKARYCSRSDFSLIEREFFRLEKGNMTVDEYACLFVEKLQHVGHLVPTDEKIVTRFEAGLPFEYKFHVGNIKTLNEAICVAKRVEEIENEKEEAKWVEEIENEKEEGEDVGEKRKWGGALGYYKKSKGEVKACYRCGMVGHFVRDCPE